LADAIAQGFGSGTDTVVVPVAQAQAGLLDGAGLLVVGGPTHVHGMSRTGTGRASKGIARLLREHGFTLVARPESFLVTRDNQLRAGEQQRARAWGEKLAAKIAPATTPSS
jgi:hypothetical protein